MFPKTGLDSLPQLPLNLLSIASVLIKDYEVKIIDQRVDDNWAKKIISESRNSICVGITSMTGEQIQHGLDISKMIPKYSTNIVWGGVHPTLLPKQTLENESIDFIVRGEGEIVFPRLLKAIIDKKELNNINGIGFKNKNGIRINKRDDYLDLNNLPDLPYDLLNMNNYVAKRDVFKKCLTLETSRGCPHNCYFCANPTIHKRKWRCLNVENIVRKMNFLQNKFDLDGMIFQEDNFFVDTKRVIEFCDKVINNSINIGWKANCRINYLLNKDETFLARLEKSGCKLLQFGIESGSDRILKLLNKGFTTDDVLKINKKLAKSEILCRYNFIVGFPTETIDEIQETLKFIEKLMRENPNLDSPFLNIYTPWPGTKLFNLAVKNGFIPPNSLEKWSNFNWNSCNLPWINEKVSTFLEEISIKYRSSNKYFLSLND